MYMYVYVPVPVLSLNLAVRSSIHRTNHTVLVLYFTLTLNRGGVRLACHVSCAFICLKR
jgi:hypothetical protein